MTAHLCMGLSTVCLSALCVCPLDGLVGWLTVCLPACLSVCLFFCMSVCLPVCLHICLCAFLPVALFSCFLCQCHTAPLAYSALVALLLQNIKTYQFPVLPCNERQLHSTCAWGLSVCLSVCLSDCLSVCLSVPTCLLLRLNAVSTTDWR